MAQTTNTLGGRYKVQFDSDESISVGTSYVTALTINCTNVTESVIDISNTHASQTLTYEIFGTAKQSPNFADTTSAEWMNLLSVQGSSYDHTTNKTISASSTNGRAYESFGNPWQWVLLVVKGSGAATTAKVYHRGQNF